MKRLFSLFAGAVLCAISTAATAQQIEPGEWQFNSTMTSPMFPKPQVTSITQCVKPQDAGDPGKWMSRQGESDCKITPGARSGDSYSWEMSCPKSGMRGKGSMKGGKDSFTSDMQMAGEMKGQKFEMRTQTTGKRLGPCKS
jgi:hypothetical protein